MLRKMRLILLLSFVSLFAAAEVKAQTVKPQLTCSDSSGSATAQSCNTIIVLSGAGGAPGLFDVLLYTTGTTNTGDLTVAVNGGSAFHVRKNLGLSTLAAGDMPANTVVQLTFDGTYWETAAIGNTPGSLPSGTQGQPAVNTSGSNVYATSGLFDDCSQFSGTNFGLGSCLTAVPNSTADARSLGGTQTLTATVTVGDSTNTSGQVLQLPSKSLYQCQGVPNGSGAGACLFQFGGTVIKADGVGGSSNSLFEVIGTTVPTPAYMYSNNTGNAKFAKLSGVKFLNTNTNATKLSSGIDFFWDWVDDGSSTVDVAVADSAGTGVLFEPFATCCGNYHLGLNLDGRSNAANIPLYIKGGSSHNIGINFFAGSFDHSGVSHPDVLFDDPQHISVANSFGEYNESNGTTPNSVCYHSLSGVQSMNYFGLLINPIVAASTACGITIDNTFASGVTLVGGSFSNNGNMTFPATFVTNNQTGNTAATDAEGNIGFYTSSLAYFDAPVKMFNTLNAGVTTVTRLGTGTPPTACGSATGCIAATEGATTGTPTAGQDYIRADSTAHVFLCSYNGAAEATCGGGASPGNYTILAKTANYTTVAADFGSSTLNATEVIYTISTSTTVTHTLPSALTGITTGGSEVIRNDCASTFGLYIAPATLTLDGATTQMFLEPCDRVEIVSNGTNFISDLKQNGTPGGVPFPYNTLNGGVGAGFPFTAVANTPFVTKFYLPVPIKLSKFLFSIQTGVASCVVDFALADIGNNNNTHVTSVLVCTGGGNFNDSVSTPLVLAPGVYYFGGCTNVTTTLSIGSYVLSGQAAQFQQSAETGSQGTSNTACTAGVFSGTTFGTITNSNSPGFFPTTWAN